MCNFHTFHARLDLPRNVFATQAAAMVFIHLLWFQRSKTRLLALEVSTNSNILLPPSLPLTFFCRPRPRPECQNCFCKPLQHIIDCFSRNHIVRNVWRAGFSLISDCVKIATCISLGVLQKRMLVHKQLKCNEIHCNYACFFDFTLFRWRCSENANWRSCPRRRACFFIVAALRGSANSVFFNTSAARACCACVLARCPFLQKSRLMTPLM